MLRAIAGAIGRYVSPADVHLYGVDCGNNALLPLVALPHVGAVVTRDQTDRMDRLIARLRAEIAQRQQQLAVGGFADVGRAAGPRRRRPSGCRTSWSSSTAGRASSRPTTASTAAASSTAWQQIMQEGAGVGIKVVMTGDRSLLVGRMSTLFDDKLLLRMVDASDFGTIGMTSRQVPSSMIEGRGFRAEGLRETQVALLADDPAGTAQVARAAGDRAARRPAAHADVPRAARPFRVDVLPVRIGMAEALALGDAARCAVEPAGGRRR